LVRSAFLGTCNLAPEVTQAPAKLSYEAWFRRGSGVGLVEGIKELIPVKEALL
jgi:hypothetical protein